jgi:hypothetical protein
VGEQPVRSGFAQSRRQVDDGEVELKGTFRLIQQPTKDSGSAHGRMMCIRYLLLYALIVPTPVSPLPGAAFEPMTSKHL